MPIQNRRANIGRRAGIERLLLGKRMTAAGTQKEKTKTGSEAPTARRS